MNPATEKWCQEQHGISWNVGTAVLVLVGLEVLSNAGGFPSGEGLVGKAPPALVPGGDLEVPLPMVFGEIEVFCFVC